MSTVLITPREIKRRLAHGDLEKIKEITGYSYDTVRRMENQAVIDEALKMIEKSEVKKAKTAKQLSKLK